MKLKHQQINRCAVLEMATYSQASHPKIFFPLFWNLSSPGPTSADMNDELIDYAELQWRLKSLYPAVFTYAEVLPILECVCCYLVRPGSDSQTFKLENLQTRTFRIGSIYGRMRRGAFETKWPSIRALCSLFLPTPLCSSSVRICNNIQNRVTCNTHTYFCTWLNRDKVKSYCYRRNTIRKIFSWNLKEGYIMFL